MSRLIPIFSIAIAFFSPLAAIAGNVLESFRITTDNVEVRETNETSLSLMSTRNTYLVKIEPNREGRVIFALSGIGYATTAKVPRLKFGVRVTGYCDEDVVAPTFSIDDNNKAIEFYGDTLVFSRIHGTLPVWFDQELDSVKLEFFNSMNLDIDQYLGIHDLKVIPPVDVIANPDPGSVRNSEVMFAIDGSSSITRNERTLISRQLLDLVRSKTVKQDTNDLCIVEYGTDIHASVESSTKGDLASTLKKYKRDKNNRSNDKRFTDWSVAFDEAITRKPGIFVFITDGWSNWSNGAPASFTAQFEELINKCNTLKEQGTRILFVTAAMVNDDAARAGLHPFLNGERTREVSEEQLDAYNDLLDYDLVTMDSFEHFDELELESLFRGVVDIATGEF